MNSWRWIIPAILIHLTSCGGGATSSPDCSIEINGDSILVGPTLQETPIQTLQRLNPSLKIIDKTVIGLTLADLYLGYTSPYKNGPIAPQMPFKSILRTSRFIVIELGGNDALGSIDSYESQLRDIVQTVLSEKRIPILTGIIQLSPGPIFDQASIDRTLQINAIQHRIALEFGIPISTFDQGPFDPTKDTIDLIHRTQAASIVLMEKLNTTIVSVCTKQ